MKFSGEVRQAVDEIRAASFHHSFISGGDDIAEKSFRR